MPKLRMTLTALAVAGMSLLGSTTMATSASAAPSAEGAAAVEGELLTTWLRRVTSPDLPSGCVPVNLARVLPDRKRQLVTAVPCTSRAVVPPAITLPAGFEKQSGAAFVAKVSELSGVSSNDASKAIAEAAGVPVSKLSTMTVGSLGSSMLLAHASVTDVPDGAGTAEKTSWWTSSGQSGTLSGWDEALLWGAIGAGVGLGASGGNPVGAVVGAVIGFIIGLL